MKTYHDILNELVGREGRYSNNPLDPGGETCWGITIAVARRFGYMGPMKDMPKDVAFDIYMKWYWVMPGFAQIDVFCQRVAVELLDTGVNMGQETASRFLQRCLNVLNRGGTAWPDLVADGHIGGQTVAALRALIDQRKEDGVTVLMRMLNALQAVRYIEIAEAKPTQEEFVFGWELNRVEM